MDKKQRKTKSIKQEKKTRVSNGIVEENGKAYILCGDKKVPLVGGYIRLN